MKSKTSNTADGVINHGRRNMLQTTAAVGTVGILGDCSSFIGSENGGQRIPIYGNEGAIYIPVYESGIENGVWEEHDVNINQNVVGFGQFTRSFTANQTSATSFPTLSSIQNIDPNSVATQRVGNSGTRRGCFVIQPVDYIRMAVNQRSG